jgi:hypothetical protein
VLLLLPPSSCHFSPPTHLPIGQLSACAGYEQFRVHLESSVGGLCKEHTLPSSSVPTTASPVAIALTLGFTPAFDLSPAVAFLLQSSHSYRLHCNELCYDFYRFSSIERPSFLSIYHNITSHHRAGLSPTAPSSGVLSLAWIATFGHN